MGGEGGVGARDWDVEATGTGLRFCEGGEGSGMEVKGGRTDIQCHITCQCQHNACIIRMS